MSSPKHVPAATPSSLATVRADGALTFRLRIRSASARGNTWPEAPSAPGAGEPRRAALEGFAPSVRRAHAPCAEAAPPLRSRTDTGGGAALRFARCRYADCDALCGGTRGGGARCAAGRAQRRRLRGPCPKPAAGWRDLGARPQRARPPRREDCCIGREAHLRLTTHQVPLSRLAHVDQLALQEISFSPKPRPPAPKGSRRQHKGGSRPLPHSHQRRYLDLSGCCDMRGQMLMYTRIEFAHDGVKQPQICSPALIKRSHAAAGGSSSHRQHR